MLRKKNFKKFQILNKIIFLILKKRFIILESNKGFFFLQIPSIIFFILNKRKNYIKCKLYINNKKKKKY